MYVSKIIADATGKLLEMFQTGKMPEAIALTIIKKKDGDDQPSFHWSLGNQILMYVQGTTDARGFDQWKSVGRYVKKGAKAIWIQAPLVKKIKSEEEETVIITGFRPIPVFRYEDTDGKEIEKPNYDPNELPPFWDVAERLGISVNYAPLNGNYYGKYSPGSKKITLCSQDAFIYFHELAHAVHGTFKDLNKGQDVEQEIVAEITAAVLCQLQGIHGYESQAYEYIKGYTRGQDVLKCIMRVLGEVEMVVMKILEVAAWKSACDQVVNL